MPTLPAVYRDFHTGLNTRDSPWLLQDSDSRDCQNVLASTAGAIVKRQGLSTFVGSGIGVPTSLYALEALSPSVLIVASGTSLYAISEGGAVTTIKTGLTNNARWQFAAAPVIGGQGPLYGLNGVDPPQQWTGTGGAATWTNTSGSVGVPNGKYILYLENQVFIAGVPTAPSRVYWSGISDPTDWDPANLHGAGFMDFDPNDGGAITATGRVGPYVVVAKGRKLWVIVDTATATSRRISTQVGCVSNRTMQEGVEGCYFLADDRNVYVTNGSSLKQVSDKINPTLQSVSSALIGQTVGHYYLNHYYLSVPMGGGANDTTFDYDANLQSWWKHTFGSNHFWSWHPNGIGGLYSAKSTAAIIDQCFSPGALMDNGTPFQWYWKGPWQSPSFYRRALFPTPYYRKRLRQIRIEGIGTVDYSLATDFAAGAQLRRADLFDVGAAAAGLWAGAGYWAGDDGTVWGDQALVRRARVYSGPVANAFSVMFSATSNTADMVTLYTLMLTDRKDLVVS